MSSIVASIDQFSPNAAVAVSLSHHSAGLIWQVRLTSLSCITQVLAVHAAASWSEDPSPATRLAVWVFRYSAVCTMLADVFWLLWFGPPRLLRAAATMLSGPNAAQAALAQEGAFMQSFLRVQASP